MKDTPATDTPAVVAGLADRIISSAEALSREERLNLFGVEVLVVCTTVAARIASTEGRSRDSFGPKDAWIEAFENVFDPDTRERVFTGEQIHWMLDSAPAGPITQLLQTFNRVNAIDVGAEDEAGKDS